MKRKEIDVAVREGRAAILPEWLQPGREVWYWRESLCDEDGCLDMVTVACPINAGFRWHEEEVRSCARQHPVLEKAEIYSVFASWSERGVEWIINGLPAVPDCLFRESFFVSEAEARRHRPGEVV